MRSHALSVIAVIFCIVLHFADAQDRPINNFIGSNGDAWEKPESWSLKRSPTPADIVQLSEGVRVSISTPVTAYQIQGSGCLICDEDAASLSVSAIISKLWLLKGKAKKKCNLILLKGPISLEGTLTGSSPESWTVRTARHDKTSASIMVGGSGLNLTSVTLIVEGAKVNGGQIIVGANKGSALLSLNNTVVTNFISVQSGGTLRTRGRPKVSLGKVQMVYGEIVKLNYDGLAIETLNFPATQPVNGSRFIIQESRKGRVDLPSVTGMAFIDVIANDTTIALGCLTSLTTYPVVTVNATTHATVLINKVQSSSLIVVGKGNAVDIVIPERSIFGNLHLEFRDESTNGSVSVKGELTLIYTKLNLISRSSVTLTESLTVKQVGNLGGQLYLLAPQVTFLGKAVTPQQSNPTLILENCAYVAVGGYGSPGATALFKDVSVINSPECLTELTQEHGIILSSGVTLNMIASPSSSSSSSLAATPLSIATNVTVPLNSALVLMTQGTTPLRVSKVFSQGQIVINSTLIEIDRLTFSKGGSLSGGTSRNKRLTGTTLTSFDIVNINTASLLEIEYQDIIADKVLLGGTGGWLKVVRKISGYTLSKLTNNTQANITGTGSHGWVVQMIGGSNGNGNGNGNDDASEYGYKSIARYGDDTLSMPKASGLLLNGDVIVLDTYVELGNQINALGGTLSVDYMLKLLPTVSVSILTLYADTAQSVMLDGKLDVTQQLKLDGDVTQIKPSFSASGTGRVLCANGFSIARMVDMISLFSGCKSP